MFQVESSAITLPDDVVGFIDLLNGFGEQHPSLENFFSRDSDLVLTRSPGRLDVMGGIADYSGSLVLQLPTLESTLVALQRDRSRSISMISLAGAPEEQSLRLDMPLEVLEDARGPVSYDAARHYFAGDPSRHWSSYVAGAFLVLMRERHVTFSEGARILIASNLPQGKGVSSSAAIEVAVMKAIASSFDLSIEDHDLALLCQKVENSVVGAPCGIMDQMTAVCGEAGKLVALLCQPAVLQGMISIPDDVSVWGLDSGVRHSVSGAMYSSVRVGAFMGYRMIADQAGLPVSASHGGPVVIDDAKWGGYLANIDPSEFEQRYLASLPVVMSGSEFISRYKGTTDGTTSVDPDRSYPVRNATAHPVYEHARVRAFAALLAGDTSDSQLAALGDLMYKSNASYSACGLASEGTDLLVELIRAAGSRNGLYGARITGGGSGGTVAVLGRASAGRAVQDVAERYAARTGYKPYIFRRSSHGAARFGHLRVRSTL